MMFFIILGIVLWIIFAFWPAHIGKSKGYSFIGFFVFSLFFFFISLIVAYLVPDRTKSNSES